MISSINSTIYRIGLLDQTQTKLNNQLASGDKLQYGSDDSVLYSRLVHVDNSIQTNNGLRDQINRVDVLNKTSDTSLNDAKKNVEYIKSELIKANTSTTGIEGLEAIAQNLAGMKESIFNLANTSTEGQYVFSGSDASVKPFVMDANGKVTYQGNDSLRKVAIDDGSYRDAGVNGLDAFYYTTDSGLKGETLTFKEGDRIVDQDGNEWKLNSPTNDTLTKTNWDGSTETLAVIHDPVTGEYQASLPTADGTKFEARRSVFDMLDEAVRSLRGLDELGNPVSPTDDTANYEFRRAGISKAVDEISKVHDSLTISHSDLGAKNKTFQVSLERLNSKNTQLGILKTELGKANEADIAIKLKALELSYASVYSTVNRTFELSLVNFMR
ncbi:flagellar hook-associated protein 3 [Aliarcobacter vitoriensis]|uniref:Flagellar biosynthesis protein FlgL n=1 Tax=Aliarcobacter vitoriensis TaxID=2011099 RepID=A0A366MU21_9BACT|nr:flagellar hook-associated protein 3 [Aliarcobacter vitoriensis]RBQ29768.1 flagellar biosynthesis protein FlgL [Aliarcobacter vitoriensis]